MRAFENLGRAFSLPPARTCLLLRVFEAGLPLDTDPACCRRVNAASPCCARLPKFSLRVLPKEGAARPR